MARYARGSGGRSAGRIPWGDVVLASIASVSWAMAGMAGTAALGLHLLGADSAGALGPMTAAVMVLGAGGSVSPSGDVEAFGLDGAEAHTALAVTPLGVGLVGALLLSLFFLRSLRGVGVVVSGAELAVRAGVVAVMFVAVLGGLAWAGHDVVTIDGGALGPPGYQGREEVAVCPAGSAIWAIWVGCCRTGWRISHERRHRSGSPSTHPSPLQVARVGFSECWSSPYSPRAAPRCRPGWHGWTGRCGLRRPRSCRCC